MEIINESQQLWNDFKSGLIKAINDIPLNNIDDAWKSLPNRTVFYFDLLLPKIADSLQLKFKKESFFRSDGVFFKQGGQNHYVPIIFIESENNAKTSNHEINKLCCLNAPLKILFICNEWTESTIKQLSEGYWNYIIEDFLDESKLIGYLAIIVAEWNESLCFHSYVYNDKGRVIENNCFIKL